MERRFLRMFAIFALLGSLLLNLFLYREARNWYRNFNRVRLDPLNLDAFSEKEEQVEGKKPLVLFFGDSRAYAWPAPDLAQFTFANRGVNGHTTTQCLLRFADHVSPLEPDILVVQVGVNDLVATALLPDESAEIVANTKANIREIVARARAMGTTVVLTTIFPPGPVPLHQYPLWSEEIAQAIEEVNADLRSLAGGGVIVMETAPILAAESGRVRAIYAADHLHLNEKGYAALNEALTPILLTYSHPE